MYQVYAKCEGFTGIVYTTDDRNNADQISRDLIGKPLYYTDTLDEPTTQIGTVLATWVVDYPEVTVRSNITASRKGWLI